MDKREKLDIIYEDKDIILVNKKAHLLTISTENEKEKTLFHQVLTYLKKKNKNNKVFIVHRLDKDTSGLVLFAKNEVAKKRLQNDWDNYKRKYVAVLNGVPEPKKGTIKNYLAETKTLLVYETEDKTIGKLAITDYNVIRNNKKYSLVDINIRTGRKNQIRVHMSNLNCPIVGDKKYSNIKTDPLRRLCLHAYYLEFTHPSTKKIMSFELDVPNNFIELTESILN